MLSSLGWCPPRTASAPHRSVATEAAVWIALLAASELFYAGLRGAETLRRGTKALFMFPSPAHMLPPARRRRHDPSEPDATVPRDGTFASTAAGGGDAAAALLCNPAPQAQAWAALAPSQLLLLILFPPLGRRRRSGGGAPPPKPRAIYEVMPAPDA
eukprot:CAMPEP_0172186284 /NCGR_PEP_ID=MMETSP1050-20130122/20668_1 /TAXON_ID=233186 /ORGANISM="Cryptomonas curvata, Strain CCAP979/52" /LENGTH=156 /DNA_ID=CAMNT_0012860421 /DNA_START=109 /DNA_END=576 /DNA_ORIENTATION=-